MNAPLPAPVLARFDATVHRSKNRQVSIPAEAQRVLGLERRAENHIVLVSLRPKGVGRWNHHYLKLTSDNEFAIPSDVTRLRAGDEVEVKVLRIIADVTVSPTGSHRGAAALQRLAERPREGWRTDGSTRIDDSLREEL